jgi:hypothetical protein
MATSSEKKSAGSTNSHRLRVRGFAQMDDVDISFGDLTVLVGAQATGKSLTLEWLKFAIDGRLVVDKLAEAGHPTSDSAMLVDLIFGNGMANAWDETTEVSFDNKRITPKGWRRRGDGKEHLFFVPAHRSMLISDGWAAPFQRLTSDTPVVARLFSQNLFDRFSGKDAGTLFPVEKRLKTAVRERINDAVFHGGAVGIEETPQHAKRLRLTHGAAHLPFMTWTAGQREFTPLLLGLLYLLPSTTLRKRAGLDWVVIEEPEMGLHPEAITAVLLLVLDLLWRGYRVVVSTHSPQVLTAVWMLRRLQEHRARWQLVCEAFGLSPSQQMQPVAEAALTKSYRSFLLAYAKDGRVCSKDISELDPESDDVDVAGWGGLTGFSSRFGDAVRKAVNEE